jgi:hypothetical protein
MTFPVFDQLLDGGQAENDGEGNEGDVTTGWRNVRNLLEETNDLVVPVFNIVFFAFLIVKAEANNKQGPVRRYKTNC